MSESDAEVDDALDEKRGTAPLKLTVRNVRSLLKVSVNRKPLKTLF